MAAQLAPLGVNDPDAEWGDYVFLRTFDEKVFRASLVRAVKEDRAGGLNADGNRAIMFCTTTDPYQVLKAPFGDPLLEMMRWALEIIRDESNLNVRILTRSPLARTHFGLMESFGPRLMFGMSVPTLNDQLMRIYEPHAPSASRRLETLQAAKAAGLNVYVAMAPTYPECGLADIRATMKAWVELEPLTIFHEPINIRADNIARIEAHAAAHGLTVNMAPLKDKQSWAEYSLNQLRNVVDVAKELKLLHSLHLWPDKAMAAQLSQLAVTQWCEAWWDQISHWPGGR